MNTAHNDTFPFFGRWPDLVATISTKADGNNYFGATGDATTDAATPANRAAFLAALGIPDDRLVSAGLVHGAAAHHAAPDDGGRVIPGVDALFTAARGVFLSITIADCLPVYLFDPETDIVGIVHAGWRGLAGGIVANTVSAMARECGVRPETLFAQIGPGIGACHFEVKDDVARRFSADHPGAVIKRSGNGATFVDLPTVARAQLAAAGVPGTHIAASAECTYDLPEKYFSWRRDHPAVKETMMAVIGLRP